MFKFIKNLFIFLFSIFILFFFIYFFVGENNCKNIEKIEENIVKQKEEYIPVQNNLEDNELEEKNNNLKKDYIENNIIEKENEKVKNIKNVDSIEKINVIKETNTKDYKKLIVIDAGHQKKGNSEKEPIGPTSNEMKAKVASGTTGIVTNIPEYELTLEISLRLRDKLINEGYEVVMIRDSHDVNISNAERAIIANNTNGDLFLRIHANGSEDSSVTGILTLLILLNLKLLYLILRLTL